MKRQIAILLEPFNAFWQRNPAMCYALALLLGMYASFSWTYVLLVPMLALGISLFHHSLTRLSLSCALCAAAFIFTQCHYHFPTETIEGRGYFEIESIQLVKHHFGNHWKYRGNIRKFIADKKMNETVKNISCTITIPQKKGITRPPADRSYWVRGILSPNGHSALLSPDLAQAWHPIAKSFSIAEIRYHAKKKVREFIARQIKGQQNRTFLSGLATGEFDDLLLAHDFVRFGLQHIMAISGFHFAILAGILSFLLRSFFSTKKMSLILIFLLSTYFLFLGASPSIIRAWVSILIALLSTFFERERSGINSLGVGIIAICLFNPLLILTIGFQFSVATTAAILILYPTVNRWMRKLWKQRTVSQMIQMTAIDQHGYCILSFFREAMALTIAVNLTALPMTLFFFQKFPLMSLIYNLFFPFFVSFSMFLLILGCSAGLILPFLAKGIHWFNSLYTHFILNMVTSMPASLDFTWRLNVVSSEAMVLFLTLVFGLGIFFLAREQTDSPFHYL